MAIACLALILGLGTWSPPAQAADRSEFRGYVALNELIRDRMIRPGVDFELGSYLREQYNPFRETLLDLLGTYKNSGSQVEFRNGQPNPVNTLIYSVLLGGLASDIGSLCVTPPVSPSLAPKHDPVRDSASPEFIAKVKPLCAWPAADARKDEVLFDYWTAVMGFEAPYPEFEAWRDFFGGAEWQARPAHEVVEKMAMAMLMNPFFLLR